MRSNYTCGGSKQMGAFPIACKSLSLPYLQHLSSFSKDIETGTLEDLGIQMNTQLNIQDRIPSRDELEPLQICPVSETRSKT